MLAISIEGDSYNTNVKTLKEFPKNYAMMIVTIISILANKEIWLHRSYSYGHRPTFDKRFPTDSLNYLATFCCESLKHSFPIT